LALRGLFVLSGDGESFGEKELIVGEDEGFGIEVVLFGKVSFHTVKCLSQFVLAGEGADLREVIDTSVGRLLADFSDGEGVICPIEGV
jgi:hypothetical protein